MKSRVRQAEYHEGPTAARRSETTLTRILTLSKEELAKREAAYQKARRAKKARKSRP